MEKINNQQITNIAEHPEFIPEVAEWYKGYWGIYYPQRTLKDWENLIPLNTDTIPLTLISFDNTSNPNTLLGTANLCYQGMADYRPKAVWLNAVFTNPAYRNQGVASKLIKKLIDIAKNLQINQIMLCTYTDGKLYEKLGWKTISIVEYRGKSTLIMENNLTSS